MKLSDIIRRAFRSLRQAKARTFLTALAIAVGAFTLTLALAVGEGARQYADALISTNIDRAALLVSKDDNLFGQNGQATGPREYDPDAGEFNGITIERLTEDDIEKIAALPGIESVKPQYTISPQFVTRGGQKKYTASVEVYNETRRPSIKAGSLGVGDLEQGTTIIPESYVQPLGFATAEAALGKTITVQLQRPADVSSKDIKQLIARDGPEALDNLDPFETKTESFTIAAVSQREATSIEPTDTLKVSEPDAKALSDYVTEGTDDFRKYVAASVRVSDGENDLAKVEAAQGTIESAGYTALSAEDAQTFLFQIVGVLQGIVAGFGVLALIASVFGVINTQYISVLERTSQIGLMKALGMKKFDVGTLFRIEAALIGLLGGTIGAAGAVGLGIALNPFITESLSLGEDVYLLVFQPLPIVGLIILLMVVAVLAGLLPARKAAKLNPIEALRTE